MLPDNIEIMQRVQEAIPSFVRFESFDYASLLDGKSLDEFLALKVPGSKILLARGNGEVGLVYERWAVALRERARENIETAPDCIKVGSELDLKRDGQRLFFGK